jgi:hypothetical protein
MVSMPFAGAEAAYPVQIPQEKVSMPFAGAEGSSTSISRNIPKQRLKQPFFGGLCLTPLETRVFATSMHFE